MHSDSVSSYEGRLDDFSKAQKPQAPRSIPIEQADSEARKPTIPGFVRVDEPANPGGENHIASKCIIG